MDETITVSKTVYDQLCEDQAFLDALRAAGVDNWQGYSEAYKILEEWNK